MFKANLKTLIVGMVLASILGTLALITFLPARSHAPGRTERGEMRSLMRDLMSRQEIYWTDNYAYSSETEAIGLVVPEGIVVRIELVDADGELIGYRAVARSLTIDYECRTGIDAQGASKGLPADSAVNVSQFGFACEGRGL